MDWCDFLVIGGGIAGSTCAAELARLRPTSTIVLVSATSIVKEGRVTRQVTPMLMEMDVWERSADDFNQTHPKISVARGIISEVNELERKAVFSDGHQIGFGRCCVATGATPVLWDIHHRIIGIRDTESVVDLSSRLKDARRVLIIGNGGIAMELVHALSSNRMCQVVWAVRNKYIGNTFLDATASAFIVPSLSPLLTSNRKRATRGSQSPAYYSRDGSPSQAHANGQGGLTCGNGPMKTPCTSQEEEQRSPAAKYSSPNQYKDSGASSGPETRSNAATGPVTGGGLGPEWTKTFTGDQNQHSSSPLDEGPWLDIQYECELQRIDEDAGERSVKDHTWSIRATLTNGLVLGCDFIVSATGVTPNTDLLGPNYQRGSDGGLAVNDMMQVLRLGQSSQSSTSRRESCGKVPNNSSVLAANTSSSIFAAGDCCCLEWAQRKSDHWLQMRLWRQARDMGLYAAQCMANRVDELMSAGAFDLFAHVTTFFGHKVTLLGHYNGQGLGPDIAGFVKSRSLTKMGDSASLMESSSGRDHPACVFDSDQQTGETPQNSKDGNIPEDVQILVRMTPATEYIKVILLKGRVRGALLIGDTGLEETFENLILNQTDIRRIGSNLLDPDIDLEDFFD